MAEKAVVEIPEHTPSLSADGIDIKMSDFSIRRTINGETVSIALTKQELYNAYSLREHEFYIEDVENVLDEKETDGELGGLSADEIISNGTLFEKMVDSYTINRDKYNMEWHEAALQAITEHLPEAIALVQPAGAGSAHDTAETIPQKGSAI